MKPVHVVGGGLAGSEAAWALASAGVPVVLHEMRPVRMTDAHKTEKFAELVCSNSFRSDDWRGNAVGLLHEEMRRLGSLVMKCAEPAQVPAGSALAVDRDVFSDAVTAALAAHPLITIEREEIRSLDQLLRHSGRTEGAIRNPGANAPALRSPGFRVPGCRRIPD
jgi:methylenetetrahydrofolate--tRNA-(uracil-5-)-methyltransferase